MTGVAILLVVLLVSVEGGVVLYLLVRSEHDRRTVMSRDDAEAAARRDTPERDER